MTCLTLTPDVAQEAVERKADLVVTHHPILFRSVKRLTTGTSEGQMLLELIRAGVAVYSPHTAFDNGAGGINQWLANKLELKAVAPLRPVAEPAAADSDRRSVAGLRPVRGFCRANSWTKFQEKIETKLNLAQYQYVGSQNSADSAGGDRLRGGGGVSPRCPPSRLPRLYHRGGPVSCLFGSQILGDRDGFVRTLRLRTSGLGDARGPVGRAVSRGVPVGERTGNRPHLLDFPMIQNCNVPADRGRNPKSLGNGGNVK